MAAGFTKGGVFIEWEISIDVKTGNFISMYKNYNYLNSNPDKVAQAQLREFINSFLDSAGLSCERERE